VKDRYCIYYVGFCNEYLLILYYLRPAIEAELPGIQIYLCGNNLPPGNRIFELSELEAKRKEMAYVRELTCDLVHHPVEELLKESSLTLKYWMPPAIKLCRNNCIICPDGKIPTKSLTSKQIEKIKLTTHGEVGDDIENKDWIVGVENEQLFKAAFNGVRTTLVPTGVGTNLYKKLFPRGEIMDLQHI
jgi:hypothetical protein